MATLKISRTDPRIVRAALAHDAVHGIMKTCREFDIDPSSVYRWRGYRATYGPDWPTNKDIHEWDAKAHERALSAARKRRYKIHHYLNRGPLLIDGTGTVRRVRALGAIGHSQADIGAELGLTSERISQIARSHHRNVFKRTADDIADLYKRWCMVVPQTKKAIYVRAYAAKKRWAPPLAWDDETIDDPKARPVGIHKNSRIKYQMDEVAIARRMAGDRSVSVHGEESREVVRRLLAEGKTTSWIAMHTGLQPNRYVHVNGPRVSKTTGEAA